ncbi:sensor protein [Calothrix parasitica NIES-267]|uniref:Sensor protein n=1 Tax=Calothrix parasitica NIES-267 TaxID=1973488 RepID=A0A1Z4LJM0_9CYAN|nr:sensor protein [Calothrix parasitica NIES-267]
MKIGTRVTLNLIVVFTIGILISGIALSNVLDRKAQGEVNSKALALMEMNNSIRNYTNEQVQPLLSDKVQTEDEFIPESIPAFSVREVFEYFRNTPEFASFLYKDATLDPTNLRDKADSFEKKIVEQFKNTNKETLSGYRTISGTKLYYTARPFSITNESCLECHSTPERAPKSLIATYGSENGFGWNLNEILGTQIVYVPAEKIFTNSRNSFFFITGIVMMIFAVVIILINLLLKTTVLERIKKIASVAEQVSVGNMNANFGKQNKDEIGDLAEAFNRMKYSLEIAMNMISKKRGNE